VDKQKTSFRLAQHLTLTAVVGLGLALAAIQLPAWAEEGLLHNIRFDQAGHRFVIDTTGSVKAMLNTLTIAGRKRVIIDLDNADIAGDLPRDSQLLQDLTAQLPNLKNVTVNQYGGNGRPIVRVLLDLQGDLGSIRLLKSQGPHIELEVSNYANSLYQNSPRPRYIEPDYAAPLRNSQAQSRPIVDPGANRPPTYQPNPAPSNRSPVSSSTDTSVSRDLYNQSLKTQQELRQQIDRLQNRLNSAASQPRQPGQDAQLEQIKRTLVVMNQRYEQLEQENQTLNSKNSELQNRLTQALTASGGSSKSNELKQQYSDLSRQYEQLKQDKLLQSQQLEQVQQTRIGQSQQIENLTRQITQLKSQIANKTTSPNVASSNDTGLAELKRQLTAAQQAMNESMKTIQEQNQEMAYLRNQVNTVKSGMDAAAKEQITGLQSQNEQKDKTIQELRQQLSNVMDRQGSHSSAAATLLQKDARITELEKTLAQANQQVLQGQTAQKELAAARQQITQLKASEQQRTVSQHTNDETKAQLLTAQKQLLASQNELSATKNQLAQLQADETQLKAARQDLTILKAEIERIKSQTRANDTASQTQKETADRLTQENQQLKRQLDQASGQLKSAQQQLAAKSGTEQSKENQSAQVSQLQKQIGDLNQQLQQAKNQLKTAQQNGSKSGSTTSAQSSELQKQVSDLTQQLSSLRRENDDLKSSLSSHSNSSATSNSDAEASYQEAKLALKAKKTADALDKFKAALLLDPNNSHYVTDYSIALSDDQQYAEAIDVLRRYLQRNTLDREAYNQLGKIYLLNDQAEAANQSFMRAIPVSTLNNYATSLKKLGKLDAAENMFKLALSINPKDSEVLFNLGNLYNNQNKLEQARNKYLEAIQIRPDFAEAHYNLGLIFSKMGDNPKAVDHLEKFLQLSPNARNVETIRAYIQKLKA